ncbi:hypothetical protein AJ80_00370 [Polytolypa hystricis UAMH7299]|uniref:Uncharacterized protein n=1 Tax=Polytolypa hystricis (strain UAMH7299) TaxID=1447883 RepID=A0A2B7Z339_POLH7|nr:hypothetical protein AJ80_00370 [Polytolypa hystricis UAMH7299]
MTDMSLSHTYTSVLLHNVCMKSSCSRIDIFRQFYKAFIATVCWNTTADQLPLKEEEAQPSSGNAVLFIGKHNQQCISEEQHFNMQLVVEQTREGKLGNVPINNVIQPLSTSPDRSAFSYCVNSLANSCSAQSSSIGPNLSNFDYTSKTNSLIKRRCYRRKGQACHLEDETCYTPNTANANGQNTQPNVLEICQPAEISLLENPSEQQDIPPERERVNTNDHSNLGENDTYISSHAPRPCSHPIVNTHKEQPMVFAQDSILQTQNVNITNNTVSSPSQFQEMTRLVSLANVVGNISALMIRD